MVPIWFKFSKLPIHFFYPKALVFLASLFGSPLQLDSATLSMKRPSVACIQVEIDLLKKLPTGVRINTGANQWFWQKVEADEDLPHYCQHCWQVGHSEVTCIVKHPELKTNSMDQPASIPKGKQEYRPVRIQEQLSVSGLLATDKTQVSTLLSASPILESLPVAAPSIPPLPVIPKSPDPPFLVLVDVSVLAGVLENAPVETAQIPGLPTERALHSRPSSELAEDTNVDEKIEVDFPGHNVVLSIAGFGMPSASHSDTDASNCVFSLEEFVFLLVLYLIWFHSLLQKSSGFNPNE